MPSHPSPRSMSTSKKRTKGCVRDPKTGRCKRRTSRSK